MNSPKVFCTSLLLFVFGMTGFSFGQAQQIRLDLRTPGIVVETGAMTTRCWSLQFTRDGNHLLAAGMDKVVRQWPVQDGKLDREGMKTFRWAAYREQRGVIYCTTLSPDPEQRFIAVAGWGLRNGSIAVIDRENGEVIHGLKKSVAAQPIYSVVFSPDGRKVLFGTFDGQVACWDLGNDKVDFWGRHGNTCSNMVWRITVVSPNEAISAAEDGSRILWDLSNGKSSELPELDQFNYSAESWDRTMTAISSGRVVLQSNSAHLDYGRLHQFEIPGAYRPPVLPITDDTMVIDALRPQDCYRALAFSPDGSTLAVAVEKHDNCYVWFYHTQSGRRLHDNDREIEIPVEGIIDAMAYHPSGKTLALAGGKNDSIYLLDTETGQMTDKLDSNGRAPVEISFNAKAAEFGEMLGFQTADEPDQWHVFNFDTQNWLRSTAREEFQPVESIDTLEDWSLNHDVVSNNWSFKKYLSSVGTSKLYAGYSFPIILSIDFKVTCATFLPKMPGENGVRVLVGHMWGASLFRVVDGQPPILLRRFVGHQEEVRAIAVSQDGTRVITAGRDQTIAGWSLEPWPNQSELGVDFSLRNGSLFVNQVASGSPGWEAKLEPGDEIVRFFFDAEEIKGGPAEWLTILESPVPGKELVFFLRRKGREIVTLTTVRQRPLWRFFSTNDDEWVLWRWRDYYYNCSPRGDDLIGWQINTEVDQTPKFIAAEQYRSRFFRPDKISEILTMSKVAPEQVAEIDLKPPQLHLEIAESKPDSWKVAIRADSDQKALIAAPEEICLWVNDVKYKRWQHTVVDFKEEISIDPAHLRHGENRLLVQAYSDKGVRGDSQAVVITKPGEKPKPRLFALGVGIDDYSGTFKGEGRDSSLHDLQFCKDDCESISQVLKLQKDIRVYDDGGIITLNDKCATKKNISEALRRIAEEAGPDDLFVLFMAGHGWTRPLPGKSHDYDPTGFAFVTADFDIQHPEQTGMSFLGSSDPLLRDDDSLYEYLTRIAAHKMILLDCCHSGSIVGKETNQIRCLTPERVGPIIMVACDKNEQAWHSPTANHGIFTTALLEAFDKSFEKADVDDNGRLSCVELAYWVSDRTPQLIEQARDQLGRVGLKWSQSQHPQVFLPPIRPEHLRFGKVSVKMDAP